VLTQKIRANTHNYHKLQSAPHLPITTTTDDVLRRILRIMNRFTANKYQCGEKYCRNLGKKNISRNKLSGWLRNWSSYLILVQQRPMPHTVQLLALMNYCNASVIIIAEQPVWWHPTNNSTANKLRGRRTICYNSSNRVFLRKIDYSLCPKKSALLALS